MSNQYPPQQPDGNQQWGQSPQNAGQPQQNSWDQPQQNAWDQPQQNAWDQPQQNAWDQPQQNQPQQNTWDQPQQNQWGQQPQNAPGQNVPGQYDPAQGQWGVLPPAQLERPNSINLAVKLMYAGAVFSLLSLIVSFFTVGSVRELAEEQAAQSGLPASTVDTIVGTAIGIAVASAVLGLGLWIWMAIANGRGRSWARIVATVFFAINTLSFLSSFTQPTPALNRIMSIVGYLIALGAIVFLYRKESSEWIAQQSRPAGYR